MLKAAKLLSPLLLIFLLIGCSGDSEYGVTNPNTSDEPVGVALASKTTVPDGATLTSATLFLYVDIESMQRIDVHRVTAAWGENTATWNSFGGAYNGAIDGSFMADGTGWRHVDITALVQSWMDGTHTNNGLLLDQIAAEIPRTLFQSRETYYPPYLELCYDGGAGCEEIAPTADVTIREIYPDENWNHQSQLWTGAHTDVDPAMQSLILFDIPSAPGGGGEGCTRSMRYWQRHAGCWRGSDDLITPLLPLWLGTEGGSKSVEVDNRHEAGLYFFLSNCWGRWNKIYSLYGNLLTAKLNVANGADPADIAAVMAEADMFLADHDARSWRHLKRSERRMIHDWTRTLRSFNNGKIGPGSCE